MCSNSYEDWVSIYSNEMKSVWKEERTELRKLSMIYRAFQKELDSLKNNLSDQLSGIRSELKRKSCIEKCKKFTGLAQSERFDNIININKENQSPEIEPLQELDGNETNDEGTLIQTPSTSPFIKEIAPLPQPDKTATSPVLRKNRFKRKNSTSPPYFNLATTSEINKTPKVNERTQSRDDSNIMECSIIEDTPDLKPGKKVKGRRSRKEPKKSTLNKSRQATTLTQMFFEPRTTRKHIDSNLPSMGITEMINLINESSGSETDAELNQSDETVDNLEIPATQSTNEGDAAKSGIVLSHKKEEPPKVIYNEVVRGKERMKLKGWSCLECQDYYEGLDLPPEELQKKKDQCSRHRYKFKPREETYDGFWDLSFGPTPATQDSERSVVFNYKKP